MPSARPAQTVIRRSWTLATVSRASARFQLEQLTEIGLALSAEKNLNALLERILKAAKDLTTYIENSMK